MHTQAWPLLHLSRADPRLMASANERECTKVGQEPDQSCWNACNGWREDFPGSTPCVCVRARACVVNLRTGGRRLLRKRSYMGGAYQRYKVLLFLLLSYAFFWSMHILWMFFYRKAISAGHGSRGGATYMGQIFLRGGLHFDTYMYRISYVLHKLRIVYQELS